MTIEKIIDQGQINFEYVFRKRKELFPSVIFPIPMDEIHFVDQCRILGEFQEKLNVSERGLTRIFGISKSQVHRMLTVTKLPWSVLHYARTHELEKYVLITLAEMPVSEYRKIMIAKILQGSVRTYHHIRLEIMKLRFQKRNT